MKRSPPRLVTVLVPAHNGWGRGIIEGIVAHAVTTGWLVHVEPEGERRPLPADWVGDGIIARVSNAAVGRRLMRRRVPVVNVSAIELAGVSLPRVANDLEAAGALAAEHLLDRGFRHFAYVGGPRRSDVCRQRRGFMATLGCRGFACQVRHVPEHPTPESTAGPLAAWLESLPRPLAVCTRTHLQGRAVLDACRQAGLLVPEDVAVLAGDDDPLLCAHATPSLSAIDISTRRIGLAAAARLERLMRGGRQSADTSLVPPVGVVTRQSTDALAVPDAELARALRQIRERACDAIHVDDIVRGVALSRRQLERGFRDLLGRTPAEEIRRMRIARARQLLATSELPVAHVARACGFTSAAYLATAFRRACGISPLAFRRMGGVDLACRASVSSPQDSR